MASGTKNEFHRMEIPKFSSLADDLLTLATRRRNGNYRCGIVVLTVLHVCHDMLINSSNADDFDATV